MLTLTNQDGVQCQRFSSWAAFSSVIQLRDRLGRRATRFNLVCDQCGVDYDVSLLRNRFDLSDVFAAHSH